MHTVRAHYHGVKKTLHIALAISVASDIRNHGRGKGLKGEGEGDHCCSRLKEASDDEMRLLILKYSNVDDV